ncbi:MAG TPA: hypothetical protein VFB21_26295 [Chthonomonadaceae bacterium]|nr:hypothetical protein [Chthonomonadaceae bacterium]
MTGFSPWLAANMPRLLVWVGALCTLGLYSILYRENRVYRLFEHIFLGLATGYLIAVTWTDVLLPKWWVPMWDKGQWPFIFTLVLGLLYYFIYSKKHSWIARLLIGFFLGVASGQSFQGFVNDTWPQIPTSFKPVIPHAEVRDAAGKALARAVSWPDAVNNLLFMLILLCVMSYFFFSFEQKNVVLRRSAQWGRWLLMFSFGAIFGSTIMARLALLIDRTDFLINDFGTYIGGPLVMFVILLALIALVLYLATRPGAQEPEGGEESP